MVEAALRLKLAVDRALKIDNAAFVCGICVSRADNAVELMVHIEQKHLTVIYRPKPNKGSVNV
jgi:hypothetical protein